MKRTKFPQKRKKTGPKSRITQEVLHQVYWLCLLGATDIQLSQFFQVAPQTIDNWKHANPDFYAYLTKGKHEADIKVMQSFFKRATGYEYTENHSATTVDKEGNTITTNKTITKQVAPDTTAIIFWLKNRWRGKWADVQHMELQGTISVNHTRTIDMKNFTPEQQEVLRELSIQQLKNIQLNG